MLNKILSAVCLLTLGLTAKADLMPIVYDSGSNIYWTADTNLLGTMEAAKPDTIATIINKIGSITDFSGNHHALTTQDFGIGGSTDWYAAQAFIEYLNRIDYGHSTHWAMPTDAQIYDLYFKQLGLEPNGSPIGNQYTGQANVGPFYNVQGNGYWVNANYCTPGCPYSIMKFDNASLTEHLNSLGLQSYAWAVSSADVAAVPIPESGWLFGAGVLGLLCLNRPSKAEGNISIT